VVLRAWIEDRPHGFAKCGDGEFGRFAQSLAIAVIDENRAATGGVRAIDVAPAIAHKEAALQVDVMGSSGAKQHTGLWFPAITWFTLAGAAVETDLDAIERGECLTEFGMDRLDCLSALRSAPNVRLIRDHDEKKSRVLQLSAPIHDVRIKLEFAEIRRRKGKPIADYRAIENAVAIEKYGALTYFVLSHFVCAVFRAG
jgi:hypothetical protein